MSHGEMHSAVVAPKGNWWLPANGTERTWIAISFVWCLILFAAMPFWHFKGGQNPAGIRTKVDPMQYYERTARFIADYKVGEENGIAIVAPPAGSEVYLMGQMWQWSPALRLEKGATYTLHLSSLDVNHGFSLYPQNINLQVVPGYDYALKVTPNETGDYRVVCNEFCGAGHHTMLGKIEVLEPGAAIQGGN